jgi:cell division protein FtsI/penicillin-binding protein 2
VFLFFAFLVIKLIDIQLIKSDELSYFARRQQVDTEVIKSERGLIFDRNNVLLAYNRNDISFYVDLRIISKDDKQKLAVAFSKTFGKSRNYYLNLLKKNSKTICLEEKALFETAKPLLNYELAGLFYKEVPTRVYHYGSLASHILGYVNKDCSGVDGVDKSFEEDLSGVNGGRLVERNALGEIISVSDEQTINPVPGKSVCLTIDKNFQLILEEELKDAIKLYSAESASGIIMDPNTGEILALANIADFDPNSYWMFNDFERKNRAITDVYEPGSTFKAFSLSMLLDQNACNETEIVNVENGTYKFRNAYIRDTHKFERLTVKRILEESSNIGISKLIQRLNDETCYEYLRAFGFGTYTSVNLPGEVAGKLNKPGDWSGLTKAFLSFGYGISVTPLQLTSAFCAVINGGILYQPLIVKKKIDRVSNSVEDNSPVVVRRVISEKTSQRMRTLLESVITNGTGSLAMLDYVSAGGKTGTSKIVINKKYSDSDYYSTFIGFFPVNKPQIVCYVKINKPKGEYYGGKISAPVFKKISERIIKIEPDKYLQEQNSSKPEMKNNNKTEQTFVNAVDLKKPPAGDNKNQFVYTNNNNTMPDLSGQTMKDALEIINSLRLKYVLVGSGIVIKQSISPGTVIQKNQVCKIYCSNETVNGTRIY